jgi:hypothetical protein
MVAEEINRGIDPDVAVEDALDFVRNWAQFKIPRALTAVGSLARDVLHATGTQTADTTVFAGQLENLFLPPYTSVLEEYGLPTPVTMKLEGALRLNDAENLDDVLARLRDLQPQVRLGSFELEMLADTQKAL